MTQETSKPAISKEQFIVDYCERSGVVWKYLSQWRHAVPCDCDYELCEGWAMVPLDWLTHNGLPLAWQSSEDNS